MGNYQKMLRLISTIAVLAVASGKAVEETPVVEAGKGHFPNKGWEISDWSVGLVMGAYGPLVSYARNDDCFSAWYEWGITAIDFSHLFDKKFDTGKAKSWIFLAISLFFFTKKSINLPQVCYDELKYAKETEWHKNFGFLADDVEVNGPRVSGGGYDKKSVSWNIFTIITLALKSLKVWKNWTSEYWFWELGNAMGSLASTLFVAIDVWTDAHVITPMPAYERYLD